MSLHPSTNKKCYTPNFNKIKGAKEGKLYEIISLLTLAKRGYELSKHENPKLREFSVGREIGIGKDRKLDDVVFSYVDEESTKNLIFLQLKHYQHYYLIDSGILSTEADIAKDVASKAKDLATRVEDVRYGNMCKDFNLQKYFISYLSVREELENANTKELKDGKVKYVVLLTNNGLDIKELEGKGFILKKAPDDIVNLFTLSSETQHSNHCYQLGDVSIGLRKILKKSSDLDRLARLLAQFVVCEDYKKNRIMGLRETLIKYYHVALEREVVQKSTLKQVENGQYFREAQFREDFLDCDETASNLYPLRKALFEAMRELDESKKDANPDELKRILKEAKWKIVYNFGKSEQTDFPSEWIPVRDEDIKEFFQCFVFIVNQPRVTELELLYQRSIQDVVVENTSMKRFVDNINATGPELKDCVEELFGLDIKRHDDEKWISGNQIENFLKAKQQLLRIIFVVSEMTLIYKNEIRQYGMFHDFEKIKENVKNFLTSDCKILCVNTPVTLLSSIKISQCLNTEKNYPISVSLNILNSTKNRDCLLKAFELESISLLTIECRHAFKDHDINFLYELVNIAQTNSSKKIILIMQLENCDIFTKRIKSNFQDEEICVIENDSIDLKYFDPKEDPLAKKVLVFQGQKEKVSLSDITGINSWNSYVGNLCEGNSEQGVIDGMTLVDILSNEEIEVGSEPAGTSSLEGAYAQMYEEINLENLVNKLTSQEHGNDANDMYIITGISGSRKQDKVIQHLGLSNEKEIIQDQLGGIGSDSKIQIADHQFKDKDFHRLCHRFLKKRIFWISVKCDNDETNFFLQKIYNPKFYLKRKFRNAIIKKDLKEHLIKEDLSETFIFHCIEDKQELYDYMQLNEHEMEQIEGNRKIRIFFEKSDAKSSFRELSNQNETAHFLEFEKQQFVWCESHGSLECLKKYIDHKQSEPKTFDNKRNKISLVDEDKLVGKIKDRKVVIFADDPGMGKTTTLIKLYETETESSSINKSHWVIGINLREHLESVLDHVSAKDGIGTLDVIDFLSTVDLRLNNNLAKNLLKTVLDKSKSFQAKPLLLLFDGFDEILDEVDRDRTLLLLQFIKYETAAKMWIATRCHFKELLEKKLLTIAVQFSPMDDAEKAQYIATYLKHRLYLILNKDKYRDLFGTEDEKQNNEKIHMYKAAFIDKTESIFKSDILTFIGNPLQLYKLFEDTQRNFTNWIKEILNKVDRIRTMQQLQSINYETAAKMLNETRCHFNELLEENLLTTGIQFSPMDDAEKAQYIATYVKHRLYLDLNEDKYRDFFYTEDEKQNNEKIHMYTAAFINKMKSIFKGDISTFIGTPLQLHLMLEDTLRDFKNWIEEGDDQISIFKYVCNDVWDVYEHFIERKYDVYFLKKGIRERKLQGFVKRNIERDHKDFAVSKIFEKNPKKSLDEFRDIYLLVGVIKSQGNDIEFIHKTFEEFFASKVFFDWIKKVPETHEQEYLLKNILLKPDYQLVRTFINLQLQKMSEHSTKVEGQVELDESLEQYGLIAAKLLNEENSPLIDVMGTPLHIAVKENNKNIAWFLLNSLKGHPDALRKCLFTSGEFEIQNCFKFIGTALHIACTKDDVEIVKVLLDAAEGISEDTLQEFLKCLNDRGQGALCVLSEVSAFSSISYVKNFNELLSRASNKLDLVLYKPRGALCDACHCDKEEVVDLLLHKFENEKHSLKKLLLNNEIGNALRYAKSVNIVEKLISSAKSMEDNNETLKNMLFPKTFYALPLKDAISEGKIDIVEKLLNAAKEIDDDNHTLKQLLLFKHWNRTTLLHLAALEGRGNIIKLLLETASDLGIEILEKLITAVDWNDRNAIQLMFENGHEINFDDSFKMLEKDRSQIIRKKILDIIDNIPLEIRLCPVKKMLRIAILYGNIKKVKDILGNVKNSSDPNERLRILLLDEDIMGAVLITFGRKNLEIIKKLLSCAVHMEDKGATLKKLLTKLHYKTQYVPYPVRTQYTREIESKIVKPLIFEAKNNNREHAVSILEQINNQYTEVKFSSEESYISEESEDILEESPDISEDTDDIIEEINDILEEINSKENLP